MKIPVKRWRGYYRALKRGEAWAVEFSKLDVWSQLLNWTIRTEMLEAALKYESPFLSLVCKDPKSTNLYYQPVILRIENGILFNSEDKDEQK